MDTCSAPDFLFPMKADIYYPIIDQNKYGQPIKRWTFDRTIVCNATYPGGASSSKEELKPDTILQNDTLLISRTKSDPRISSNKTTNAMTNVLITNIRDASNNHIYVETSGPRNGRSTIFEIATVQPFFGPYRDIEYYKVVLRRSENQEATD